MILIIICSALSLAAIASLACWVVELQNHIADRDRMIRDIIERVLPEAEFKLIDANSRLDQSDFVANLWWSLCADKNNRVKK